MPYSIWHDKPLPNANGLCALPICGGSRFTDETTDVTSSHLTNPAKDAGQVIGYSHSTMLSKDDNQVAGYDFTTCV
jgi:hypothetical protein